ELTLRQSSTHLPTHGTKKKGFPSHESVTKNLPSPTMVGVGKRRGRRGKEEGKKMIPIIPLIDSNFTVLRFHDASKLLNP
ncbi:MAG: hypothetical protein IJ745_00950, partial [Bacteroidales bacterium]|nr:hypothetical protein [Bacteroidales bacterium]